MYNNHELIKRWEIIGFYWIVIVGSFLHFTYELSGKSPIVGIFSPINESVWEHLKLGYFALFFFIFIQYWFLRGETNSFFLGKAIGIIAMNLFILLFFYSYTSISKNAILFLDIASFIVGAAICQALSYRVLKLNVSRTWNFIGLILFILMGYVLIQFTFTPPKLPMFMDPRTKTYGI